MAADQGSMCIPKGESLKFPQTNLVLLLILKLYYETDQSILFPEIEK
jgi:hypothetical protein